MAVFWAYEDGGGGGVTHLEFESAPSLEPWGTPLEFNPSLRKLWSKKPPYMRITSRIKKIQENEEK